MSQQEYPYMPQNAFATAVASGDVPRADVNPTANGSVVLTVPQSMSTEENHTPEEKHAIYDDAAASKAEEYFKGVGAASNKAAAKQEEEVSPFGTPKMFMKLGGALLFVWVLGWMYMGTAWNPKARLRHLYVAVMNCDAGVPVGTPLALPAAFKGASSVTSALLAQSIWNTHSPAHRLFRWQNFTCQALQHLSPPYPGPGCPPDVAAACLAELQHTLKSGNFWGAIYFPSNLTANIVNNAMMNNSTTKPPFTGSAMAWIKNSGRHLSAFSMIDGVMKVFWQGLSQGLGKAYANDPAFAGKMSPYFFISPLPLNTIDLAPVDLFGQNLSTYMLQILTWMTAIVLTAVFYNHRLMVETPEKLPEGFIPTARHVTIALLLRGLTCAVIVLVASCMNLLIVILLGLGSGVGAQFDGFNAGYAVAFLWYCGLTYLCIMVLAINIMGPVRYSSFGSFLLILQLVSSGAIFPHELCNPFFRIGFALPLTWGVRGLRMIYFGAVTNKIWRSWLVLTAWLVVTASLAIYMWVNRTVKRLNGALEARQPADDSLAEQQSLEREMSSATLAFPLTA